MPAPVAHSTGLLSAIAVPLHTGCSTVLRDAWDAEGAVEDITALDVSFSAGAAVFMQELLAALEAKGMDRLPLRAGYPCGGSSIPAALAEACDDAGMRPARSWGMTECPSVTGSSPTLHPRALRCRTDGIVLPGCEVRFVDAAGRDVDNGEGGEMLVRARSARSAT